MRLARFALFALAASALALAHVAAPLAQQQENLTGVATLTNTARAAGTAAVIGTPATTAKGVMCTFNQTAEASTPSTTISVEVEDSASQAWITLGTTAAFTGLTGSRSIIVYPGAVATAVPSGVTIVGLHLPKIWRLSQTVVGGGATTTGTANCDLLL